MTITMGKYNKKDRKNTMKPQKIVMPFGYGYIEQLMAEFGKSEKSIYDYLRGIRTKRVGKLQYEVRERAKQILAEHKKKYKK